MMAPAILQAVARASASVCEALRLPEKMVGRAFGIMAPDWTSGKAARGAARGAEQERAEPGEYDVPRTQAAVAPVVKPEHGSVFLPSGSVDEDVEMLERQAKRLRGNVARRRRLPAAGVGGDDCILAHYEQLLAGIEERIRFARGPSAECRIAREASEAATSTPSSSCAHSVGETLSDFASESGRSSRLMSAASQAH
mmetsp:Transcript_7793/g.22320  ORF Transcript_7793/g.22320 Transcript_7793/m.22320 type:complete len:197 (-) Transcript_7793:333-923(-)